MQYIPQNSDQAQINTLADPAHQYLKDCSRVLVFTGNGQVLFSKSCEVPAVQLNVMCSFATQTCSLQHSHACHVGISS